MAGSSSQYSSRSFEETSALFPTETKAENPRPRACACSRTREPERAALRGEADVPAGGKAYGAKVAFRLADAS